MWWIKGVPRFAPRGTPGIDSEWDGLRLGRGLCGNAEVTPDVPLVGDFLHSENERENHASQTPHSRTPEQALPLATE